MVDISRKGISLAVPRAEMRGSLQQNQLNRKTAKQIQELGTVLTQQANEYDRKRAEATAATKANQMTQFYLQYDRENVNKLNVEKYLVGLNEGLRKIAQDVDPDETDVFNKFYSRLANNSVLSHVRTGSVSHNKAQSRRYDDNVRVVDEHRYNEAYRSPEMGADLWKQAQLDNQNLIYSKEQIALKTLKDLGEINNHKALGHLATGDIKYITHGMKEFEKQTSQEAKDLFIQDRQLYDTILNRYRSGLEKLKGAEKKLNLKNMNDYIERMKNLDTFNDLEKTEMAVLEGEINRNNTG
jgi:hypothetical protein